MKQEITEEKNKEELIKEEATEYYNMAKEYRRDRYLKEGEESFILSKNWLKKWKNYVNYPFIKRNVQYSYYYSTYANKTYEPKLDEWPGEIDNSHLLVPTSEFLNDGDQNNPENLVIRHDISQREDLKIVNKSIWEFFFTKYGGGPEIKKGTIEEKQRFSTIPKKITEIFLRKYNIICFPSRKEFTVENLEKLKIETIYISRVKNISDLKNKICQVKSKSGNEFEFYKQEGVYLCKQENLRLWKLKTQVTLGFFKQVFSERSKEIIENEKIFKCGDLSYLEYETEKSLEELELADTDLMIVEYSTENSPWIFEIEKLEQKEGKCESCYNRRTLRYFCPCKEVWYCREECLERDKNFHTGKCKKAFEVEENGLKEYSEKSKKGLVGLQNLGNTCFMNTSLQCVSNCYELTEYFLKDLFKKDINTDNPIGTGGVLAKAYAEFLKNVWYGDNGVFSPWNFKRALASFQSMFTGYQQHDTQEFLNFLLDGLHEDLNRVIKKPLVEKDDSKKEDSIKSAEQWIGFQRRNQSTLVDLLYGQYKSTLYCPDSECQNVSTTFDPFMSLSLPLVAKTETYEITCFFIFYDLKIKPLQLNLPFSIETTIMALRNKVGKMLMIHPFSFFVIKMDEKGNYDHLVNSSALIKINNYYHSDNQKPFFLFQIDPEVFYSNYNKFTLENQSLIKLKRDFNNITEEMTTREEENKKLFSDDYEEDESGVTSETLCYYSKSNFQLASGRKHTTTTLVNVDDNYGFGKEFIKTIITLMKYEETPLAKNQIRQRIIFPRIVYLNKNWTTRQAHFYVFKYFAYLIRINNNLEEEENPDDELWLKFFDNYKTDNNDSYEYHKKNNWPYILRMKNNNEGRFDKCFYCNSENCENCLLPYDDNITIGDLIDKIPKNEEMEIDNTYLFIGKQRFGNNSNKDFNLEATWLPEYVDTVHNLNDKRDYQFKIVKSAARKSVSIYECFKNFVKLEKLEENNEWYCPECKKHQKATKKMEIYKSPHILIVHLKRFRNNSKIDTVVDFPINGLDIGQYIISKDNELPHVYDLFAIANHYGSMGFGHYTSYAKNPFTNQWYDFDDSHVSKKSEDDLVGSSAYVLFYRRRGLENILNLNEIYNRSFIDYENLNNNINNNFNNVSEGNTNLLDQMEVESFAKINTNLIDENDSGISNLENSSHASVATNAAYIPNVSHIENTPNNDNVFMSDANLNASGAFIDEPNLKENRSRGL